MLKKFLSLILLTVLVLTSFVIPAYADSVIGEIGTEEMGPIENDRVPLKDSYTEDELKSILAGDHNFDIPDEGLAFNAENFPLEVDENVVSPNILNIVEDDYYIAVQETGKILIAPNSTYITTTNYSESEAYMWEFDEVSAYTYAIRNKLNPDTCLAASPSSSGNSAVVKKTYSATDVTCHWSMHVYDSGNVLRSEATGTNAAGQYLYISGNQFVLSTSNRTKIGLIDVDWFIPCTAITCRNMAVAVGSNYYMYAPIFTPDNSTCNGNNWLSFASGNTSICTINTSGRVTGVSLGLATVTITHKITRVTGSFTVRVLTPLTYNARVYYDSGSTLSVATISDVYSCAVSDIYKTYCINFVLSSVSQSSQLDGNSCPNSTVSEICTLSCGTDSTCNTTHHKGSSRLLNKLKSDSYYTYRLVSHALCYYDSDDGSHGEVVGLGNRLGKNAVTSMESTSNLERSIQHELTHNLGGTHRTCISSQMCVLQGDYGYWCDNCYTEILEGRG